MNMKSDLKEAFINGVIEAVSAFEKKASFNSWMKNDRFRSKYSEKMANLVKKVKR